MLETMAEKYWKQCIEDYISCCTDFENEDFTEEQTNQVVNDLLNDDQMWKEIDDTIYYYLNKTKNN